MRRSISPLLVLALSGAFGAEAAELEACPAHYEFGEGMDFLSPKYQERIRGIERNHLNSDVENLIRGQTAAQPGDDLRFILGYIPNHHRTLAAMMRLAARDRTDSPPAIDPYTVTCWLDRAAKFNPQDGTVLLLYGVHLASSGHHREALKQLERAAVLIPNNAEVMYNLGLVDFELKNYESSREHAKRAYELGFPLPGLRRKLAAAGFPLE